MINSSVDRTRRHPIDAGCVQLAKQVRIAFDAYVSAYTLIRHAQLIKVEVGYIAGLKANCYSSQPLIINYASTTTTTHALLTDASSPLIIFGIGLDMFR